MEIGDALEMRVWILGMCGLGLLLILGGGLLIARWVSGTSRG